MPQWILAPDLAALADAVAALPRKGPLPTTTVVLPSAALGHAVSVREGGAGMIECEATE